MPKKDKALIEAQRFAQALKDYWGEEMTKDVRVFTREEGKSCAWGAVPAVTWEGGPFEWAIGYPDFLFTEDPKGFYWTPLIPKHKIAAGVHCEPWNSCTMCFYED